MMQQDKKLIVIRACIRPIVAGANDHRPHPRCSAAQGRSPEDARRFKKVPGSPACQGGCASPMASKDQQLGGYGHAITGLPVLGLCLGKEKPTISTTRLLQIFFFNAM